MTAPDSCCAHTSALTTKGGMPTTSSWSASSESSRQDCSGAPGIELEEKAPFGMNLEQNRPSISPKCREKALHWSDGATVPGGIEAYEG